MAFIIEKKKKNARESEKKLDGKGIVLTENFGIWNAQERKGEEKKYLLPRVPFFQRIFICSRAPRFRELYAILLHLLCVCVRERGKREGNWRSVVFIFQYLKKHFCDCENNSFPLSPLSQYKSLSLTQLTIVCTEYSLNATQNIWNCCKKCFFFLSLWRGEIDRGEEKAFNSSIWIFSFDPSLPLTVAQTILNS